MKSFTVLFIGLFCLWLNVILLFLNDYSGTLQLRVPNRSAESKTETKKLLCRESVPKQHYTNYEKEDCLWVSNDVVGKSRGFPKEEEKSEIDNDGNYSSWHDHQTQLSKVMVLEEGVDILNKWSYQDEHCECHGSLVEKQLGSVHAQTLLEVPYIELVEGLTECGHRSDKQANQVLSFWKSLQSYQANTFCFRLTNLFWGKIEYLLSRFLPVVIKITVYIASLVYLVLNIKKSQRITQGATAILKIYFHF